MCSSASNEYERRPAASRHVALQLPSVAYLQQGNLYSQIIDKIELTCKNQRTLTTVH